MKPTSNSDKETRRQRVLDSVGPESYNRLIESVPNTQKNGRLRYWQEELFRRTASEAGVVVSTLADFVDLFADAVPVRIVFPPLTKEQFLSNPNGLWYSLRRDEIDSAWFVEAWRTLPAFRDNVTYELTRSVSKNGNFYIAGELLKYLSGVLGEKEAVDVYIAIRDGSYRPEDEWRPEFERAFARYADALPAEQAHFGMDDE